MTDQKNAWDKYIKFLKNRYERIKLANLAMCEYNYWIAQGNDLETAYLKGINITLIYDLVESSKYKDYKHFAKL